MDKMLARQPYLVPVLLLIVANFARPVQDYDFDLNLSLAQSPHSLADLLHLFGVGCRVSREVRQDPALLHSSNIIAKVVIISTSLSGCQTFYYWEGSVF